VAFTQTCIFKLMTFFVDIQLSISSNDLKVMATDWAVDDELAVDDDELAVDELHCIVRSFSKYVVYILFLVELIISSI
jgi:hypothetical protein